MNERIKELMDKTLDDKFSHTWTTMTYEDLEKFSEQFAQLIVRMCADAADMYEGKSDCVGDCVAEYMGYGEAEGITEWRSK